MKRPTASPVSRSHGIASPVSVLLALILLIAALVVGACQPVQPSPAPLDVLATETPLPEETELAETEPADDPPAAEGTPELLEESTVDATPTEVAPILVGTVTFTATSPVEIVELTGTITATLTATATLEMTPVPTATLPITATPPITPPETPVGTPTPPLTPTGTPTVTVTPTPGEPVTPTPTPGEPPTPTPAPTTVTLRTHRTFIEGSNRIVVGEVFNGSGAPVYDVRVIATFYDQEGQLVSAQETLVYLPATLPRQTNPFRLVLNNAPAVIDRYELSLFWNDISLFEFDRATVASEEVSDSDTGLEVSGELRNDHRQALENLQVVAAFYDTGGEIVDVFVGRLQENRLASEQTTEFVIPAGRLDESSYASYLIQAQGRLER